MKTLMVLAAYAGFSAVLGLMICGLLLWNRKRKAATWAAALLFGGPVVAFAAIYVRDSLREKQFKEDVAYVQELCEKYGGDKIYKTVEGVEGVFQITARNPDMEHRWKDKYGMIDPWGIAQGDGANKSGMLSNSGNGYAFFEQQIVGNVSSEKLYLRIYLKPSGRRIGEGFPLSHRKEEIELIPTEIHVQKLISQYGYRMEEISTREMRDRWIAGGRITIVNIRTGEVLAERTGYFRAIGLGADMPWSGASAYQNHRICPNDSRLSDFLLKVLKPSKSMSIEKLESLGE